MDAISTESLTKHYHVGFWRPRPYVALDALSLSVRQGEVFGFLGPNGAGKTTTLKLLMQLVYPTSGRAEILGRPVGDVGVRRRIGYLPENAPLYHDLSVASYLDFVAEIKGVGRTARRGRVADVMERCFIGDMQNRLIGKLSKGYRQRVGLAQALLGDPEVLVRRMVVFRART